MEISINKIIKYDEHTKKVRLISIKDNNILVCKYSGMYMLPGGKIDKKETEEEAIKREIREETGSNITNVEKYLVINNYAKDYPKRFSNKQIDKKITTTYFISSESIEINNNQKLSEREYENFEIKYMSIDELLNELHSEKQTYKQRIYSKELLTVLKYYFKTYSIIDLHTHTTASDGQYDSNEVIKQAIESNINTIAITDHDTVKGLNNINYKNDLIKIIPGIELTVKRQHGRMHILGLDINYQNEMLLNYLKEIKENNRSNLKRIINYLKEHNIILQEEDIEAIFQKETNVGRPDVAKLLIKEGYVQTVQEAFDKYLIEAFNKTRKNNKGYNYETIINLIKEANGIPILAHPNSLELNHIEFEQLIKDMIEKGLMGLEIYHPNMNEEEREYYMSIVEKYNLLYSGGTDYHGEKVKPDIKLGLGRNNTYIEEISVLKYINRREK